MPNIAKFNWKEMFNNSKGKTSGMLVVCILACLVSVANFFSVGLILNGASIYGAIFHVPLVEILSSDITMFLNNLLIQSIAMFGLGVAGLGARRFTPDKQITDDTYTDETSQH